jgi:hypothetical protein
MLMYETLLFDAAAFLGSLHFLAPFAVRSTFRFSSRCQPRQIPADYLSADAAAQILPRVPKFESLGFEFLGSFDFGELAAHTGKVVAYFCNRATNDFASITVTAVPGNVSTYLEFSTSFSNGLTLETNCNGILPLTPDPPQSRVFRFPKITQPQALYECHRQLINKHASGAWAVAEPKGQEIQRLARAIENYGPRHAEIGYMRPTPDGKCYRLTWKGAALIAWRGLWPIAPLRRMIRRQKMRNELQSLEVRGVAALQKA